MQVRIGPYIPSSNCKWYRRCRPTDENWMPKRLRDDVMCFRLQIHSQWMMKTHWRAQSHRTHAVRRSDTRTPRTKQVDSGQESLRINIQKHCIHRRATTWVRRSNVARHEHSTGQSPRTIPSFSACIRTLKQRFSRHEWLAASPMSSENVLVPNKLCRCQNLHLYTIRLWSFVLFMFLYYADCW